MSRMKTGDSMTIGDATVVVTEIKERQVKLAVNAPESTKIKTKPK